MGRQRFPQGADDAAEAGFSGTRSTGVDYQPNVKRGTMVHYFVSLGNAGGGTNGLHPTIGPTAPASIQVGLIQSPGDGATWAGGCFYVPAGWYYRFTTDNGIPGGNNVAEVFM